MSHEIETFGAQAAFVTAREHAWHQLGTVLEDSFTAEQAMEVAHLGGWNVRKVPMTATEVTEDGVTTIDVPDKYAMVRTSPFTAQPEALGVVGSQYLPIQNEAHAEFLNNLVDEGGAHFETAGSLRGGREVFMTMRVPEHMKIGGIDPIDLYLVALNAHDGTQAFRLLVTPVRVVCANTQAAALRNNRSSVSIRHTKSAQSTMEEVRKALDLSFGYADEFSEMANRMIDTQLDDAKFRKIIGNLFDDPKNLSDRQLRSQEEDIAALETLFHESPTAADIRGTYWAGYQAVTEWTDFFRPVRGAKSAEEEKVLRAQRAVGTGTTAIKENAFAEFVLAMPKTSFATA